MSRSRLFVVAFSVLSLGLAVWLVLTARSHWNRTQESGLPIDCRAVLGWVDREGPKPGADGALALPDKLAEAATDRQAWLVARPEGRCVLLEREAVEGGHGADLCCEADLPGAEGAAGTGGGVIPSLGPWPFDALRATSRETKRWAKVTFQAR